MRHTLLGPRGGRNEALGVELVVLPDEKRAQPAQSGQVRGRGGADGGARDQCAFRPASANN